MTTNRWYYQVMGEVYGPVDSKTLQKLAARNEINRDTFVRRQDANWVTADRVKDLFNRNLA